MKTRRRHVTDDPIAFARAAPRSSERVNFALHVYRRHARRAGLVERGGRRGARDETRFPGACRMPTRGQLRALAVSE